MYEPLLMKYLEKNDHDNLIEINSYLNSCDGLGSTSLFTPSGCQFRCHLNSLTSVSATSGSAKLFVYILQGWG